VPVFVQYNSFLLKLKLKTLEHAVAQLVEVTSRKVAGSIPDDVFGIFINRILPAALWPMVYSACNRNALTTFDCTNT
jgi:hypothetical protein